MRTILIFLLLVSHSAFAAIAIGNNTNGTTSIAVAGTSLTVTSIPVGHAVMGSVVWATSGRSLAACAATGSTCVVASCNASLAAAGATDCFYILSVGSTLTSITLSASAQTTGNWYITDYSFTNGPMIPVTPCSSNANATSLTPPGCTLTITANSVIQQQIGCANTCSGTPAGWTNGVCLSGDCIADKINTVSGSAPTWAMSPTGTSVVAGFALSETVSNVTGAFQSGKSLFGGKFITK